MAEKDILDTLNDDNNQLFEEVGFEKKNFEKPHKKQQVFQKQFSTIGLQRKEVVEKGWDQFFIDYGHYKNYEYTNNTVILLLIYSELLKFNNELILQNSHYIEDKLFRILGSNPDSQDLKILKLLNLQGITSKMFRHIANSQNLQLEELVINNCSLIGQEIVIKQEEQTIKEYEKNFRYFLSQANSLKKLTLQNLPFQNLEINLNVKLKYNLQELTIINCKSFPGKQLYSIFTSPTLSLRMLHLEKLENCHHIFHRQLKQECEEMQLESSVFASDLTLTKRKLNLFTLEVLILKDLNGVSENDLCELLMLFFLQNIIIFLFFFRNNNELETNLKSLTLGGFENLSTEFFQELSKKKFELQTLKFVKINQISYEAFEFIASSQILAQVKDLCFKNIPQFGNSSILALSKNQQCQNLEILELNSILGKRFQFFFQYYFKEINSESLELLFKSHIVKPIKKLILDNNTNIEDMQLIQSEIDSFQFENLSFLSLKHCTFLKSSFLQAISLCQNLKTLKKLNLTNIASCTDAAFNYLAKSKTISLNTLILDQSYITLKGFETLISNDISQNIEKLSVNSCPNLTDEMFTLMLQSNSKNNLKNLKIFCCKAVNITSQGLNEFLQNINAKLEFLELSNGCLAFPVFYSSANCSSITQIKGDFSQISRNNIIEILKSKTISQKFNFQQLFKKIEVDDDILKELSQSEFLKQMWGIRISDLKQVKSEEGIIMLFKSKYLNPFFHVNKFLLDIAPILNDKMLAAIIESCASNLSTLNLSGCTNENLTSQGIANAISNQNIYPFFKINKFLGSIRYKFPKEADAEIILNALPKCPACLQINKLTLESYPANDKIIQAFTCNSVSFPNLKELELHEIKMTKISKFQN